MYFFLVGLEFMRLCYDGYGAVPLYFYINKSFYLYLKKELEPTLLTFLQEHPINLCINFSILHL